MLIVESTRYPAGWGKLAFTHRVWTARVLIGPSGSDRVDREYAAQHECPIEAAAAALSYAREVEAEG